MDQLLPYSFTPAFLLIDKFVIEIPIRSDVAAAIMRQLGEGADYQYSDPEDQLSRILTQGLRKRFTPPTIAQVKFAHAIAERLQIDLTQEILESRECCHSFIAEHVDRYRRSMGYNGK